MTMLSIATTNGHYYEGKLQGGSFEIPGHRFEASQIDKLVLNPNKFSKGVFLKDGTHLAVNFKTKGGFLKVEKCVPEISGFITIFVESLGHEMTFNADEIRRIDSLSK